MLKNFKVKVSSEAESKEVQELFSKLGYNLVNNISCENGFFVASLYSSGINFDYWADVKELTIQQLRNLVAAKTKKIPYLVKTIDKWEEQQLTSDTPESATCFKIPNGGCSLTRCEDSFLFWNHDQTMCLNPKIENVFRKYNYGGHAGYFRMNLHTMNKLVEWQRQPETISTHPEELPFIDDEQKSRKHSHYFKDVSDINEIDVYEILKRFEVTDPCLQHIVKKALCTGKRGHKDFILDLNEILDTAQRAVEINNG